MEVIPVRAPKGRPCRVPSNSLQQSPAVVGYRLGGGLSHGDPTGWSLAWSPPAFCQVRSAAVSFFPGPTDTMVYIACLILSVVPHIRHLQIPCSPTPFPVQPSQQPLLSCTLVPLPSSETIPPSTMVLRPPKNKNSAFPSLLLSTRLFGLAN
ncbi:hypothetical protein BV25DRAFT_1057372 [Artomyces pyxidatus]|uniref:Uncharacterized protein n=1 Tax=Artomyces pyxidatus TaxID=48021 RepID=A0ACB8SUP5_9AGAM|nr:hypothetical protein BV25DRAFT_1057372 [Artomyces pyxidatus]